LFVNTDVEELRESRTSPEATADGYKPRRGSHQRKH
jgi:hypothetical protein